MAGEVVVAAVLDRGADRDLGVRVDFLHGRGQRGVVADELQDLGGRVFGCHDLDRAILGDGTCEVAEVAVEADGEPGREIGR